MLACKLFIFVALRRKIILWNGLLTGISLLLRGKENGGNYYQASWAEDFN